MTHPIIMFQTHLPLFIAPRHPPRCEGVSASKPPEVLPLAHHFGQTRAHRRETHISIDGRCGRNERTKRFPIPRDGTSRPTHATQKEHRHGGEHGNEDDALTLMSKGTERNSKHHCCPQIGQEEQSHITESGELRKVEKMGHDAQNEGTHSYIYGKISGTSSQKTRECAPRGIATTRMIWDETIGFSPLLFRHFQKPFAQRAFALSHFRDAERLNFREDIQHRG